MIIRRSTDGWSPPPPPSSDELTFRGPKHPIMLLGRFCPNYFLSNHYYYILCFCSLAYYALHGIVDLVIICRFISLFLPGFVQICFFPSCYFAAWVEWWRQIDDWWFSFSANCHFFMFTPYTEQFYFSLAIVHECLVLYQKILRTITEDQDRFILLNVCVQKIVHISVTLHCSPSLP